MNDTRPVCDWHDFEDFDEEWRTRMVYCGYGDWCFEVRRWNGSEWLPVDLADCDAFLMRRVVHELEHEFPQPAA